MPLTGYGDAYSLKTLFGKSNSVPSSYYFGLFTVKQVWSSTAFSVGDLVIPQNYASTNKIFRCTTAGSSGASEPIWNTTSGATTPDGSVTWTEASPWLYVSSQVLSKEVSGGSYARQALANNNTTGNWVDPTGTVPSVAPATTNWGSQISFPQSSASWGVVAGFIIADSSTAGAGNVWAWGTLSSYLTVSSGGITVTLPATTGVTVTLA